MFCRISITLACDDSLSTSELQWRTVRTPLADCRFVEKNSSVRLSSESYGIACECNEGFTKFLDEDGKWADCEDVNECLDTSRCNGENQACRNTLGSFICDCISGYEIQSDGSCVDINECVEGHQCDQICHNTVGSYYCDCDIEFKMKGNTR